ncbi:DNA polymerase III subunit delta' [Thermodesulfovibrio yellowstonii]|uniref:DNA polymerase III subunit delta' n=1 Tax=Thermodesulfovibrio yellowstonii TaxID=28262 RepID=UPI0024B33893|nr:DNA polymerase III subunit delta' [Thermodesulfovibrio yellowstonii]MDI6865962.1 DNA polymerase III subunit delta' [Thermodesulfovibrio yellowstonii]
MGFNKIISQEKAIKLLKGTLRTKKIPNALLFLGDAYIGKTSTAIAYAKALNCLNSENEDSCDSCESCKKIEQRLHPDIKIIAPEKDVITVNTIREVEEFVSLKPLEGKYKVVIIKEAHKMNNAAANAFLKTVEEPPFMTTIILICENIHNLPEPLISRCFKVYFTPLSIDAIKKIIPDMQQESFFRIIMGKPGLFMSRDILKDIQWFSATLKNIKENNKKAIWKDNEEIKWWIDFLCIFLRDSLIKLINKVSSDCCLILPLDFKLKENISVQEIFNLYEEVQNIKRNIDLNLNKSILWNYLVSCINNLITSSENRKSST